MYRIKKNEKKLKWIKYLSLLFGCFEMKIIKWKVIWFESWKETKFKMNTSITLLKRVKCEIRSGRPNGPIGEPNKPISTRPKKVEPILSRGPPIGRRPRLAHHVSRNLFYKHGRLAQQAWETCSAGLRGLLSKSERLALQGKEAGPHHYKKAPTPSKKVCVTNSSLAL